MSITCTVTPGHTYGANHTVDYGDLNKLGTPGVSVPDGGTLAFGAGTALLPSISIAGDPDTGFFQPTVDQIAFVTGGTARLVFGAEGMTGAVRAPAGAVATPSLAFATDTDTGFYLAAPNTTGVAGTFALADGAAATPSLVFATDPDTGFARTAANTMVAACGGTAVATFSASGIDAVGLRIAGVAVSPAGLDFSAARFFDDFHSALAQNGWLVYTANGTVALMGSSDPIYQAAGTALLSVSNTANAIACAFWPHNPGGTANCGGLSKFDSTGEYVEFGFRLTSQLGTSGASSLVFLGLVAVSDSYYSTPSLLGATAMIGVQFDATNSANLQLVYGIASAVNTTITPVLGTYYRARITRTVSSYTMTINGATVATVTVSSPFIGAPGRLAMIESRTSGAGPITWVDYVQWEKPITRT